MEWFKKHKKLTVLLVIIGLVIIASASSGDKTSNNGGSSKSDSSKTEDKAQTAKIGEAARDGKFEFTVKSIKCGVATVGKDFLTETAQGQYCLLSVSIKNIGDEAQGLYSGNQYLYNAQDQKYSADDAATITAEPGNQSNSWFNDINPGNSVKGTIVFDIPKGEKPVTAELHDSAFSGGIKVSLN